MLGTLPGRLPCFTFLKHRVSHSSTPITTSSARLYKSIYGSSVTDNTIPFCVTRQFGTSSRNWLAPTSATSTRSKIMFARANTQHDSKQPVQTPASASQTAATQQTSISRNGLKRIGSGSFKTQAQFKPPVPVSKPLVVNAATRNPLSSASTNRQYSSAGSVASSSTSRSSILQSDFKRALSGASSFTDAPTTTSRAPSPDLSKMEKLRQAIYFDENDYDDDLNFDFEADDKHPPSANRSVASSKTFAPTSQMSESMSSNYTSKDRSAEIVKLTYVPPVPKSSNTITGFAKPVPKEWYASKPKLPSPAQPKAMQEAPKGVTSSAPVPWSSSPIEHHQPQTVPTPQVDAQLDRKRSSPNSISNTNEPPVKKGRRMLPWQREKEEEERKEREAKKEEEVHLAALKMKEEQKHPAGFKEDRLKVGANVLSKKSVTKTPAKKQYPWDTTASAVKAAQRDLKGTKKLQSVVVANDISAEPKRRRGQVAKMFLSDEQKHVIDMVVDGGKSVFFTGSAGTGKSVLLREIIAGLRRKHARDPDRVGVTASTGLVAGNVGGITLHSFAGIGLGRESVDVLVKKIKRNNKAKTRWLRTKVLIIDEVSMVDGDLFDKLEGVARSLKNNGRPFGGIQLVVTGDFFQLPPVPDNGKLAKFAFEAITWSTSVDHTIGLTHIFRQKDPVFAGMLNEMRLGKLSAASIEAFRKLSRPIKYDDGLEATELFPTRHEVENANASRLGQLKGDSETYAARDDSKFLDPQARDKLLSNVMAPPSLTLKINAQVMLIKNIDDTLVNGSLGRVIGFMSEKTYAMATADGNNLLDSEGEDDDADMALKRSKIREMYTSGTGRTDTSPRLPLVQFSMPDGTARQTLIQTESWKIELPTGEVQASRTQLPLILAWAISIHKAQGQTLERVKVDLGKVFEKGQAYVALSRATSQNGLQVARFDPKRVMAHEKVRSFYESLYSADRAKTPGLASKVPVPQLDEEEQALLEAQMEFDEYAESTRQAGRNRAYA